MMKVSDSAPAVNTESKTIIKSSGNETSNISSNESPPETVANDSNDLSDCPLEGSARSENLRELNRLKNRSDIPADELFNHGITLSAMLEPGYDQDRWKTNEAAEITGYVADVKVGGIETCNCKAREPDKRDTHIE